MYIYEYQPEWQYATHAIVNITDDCNLQCKYCFVQQHPHFMELETAQKIIDWLYNNYCKKLELLQTNVAPPTLTFFGGEPMLLYDKIIQPTVNYATEKYPNIFSFSMTTNGTLLNEEKIKWLFDQNFSLLLSCDGLPETQNYNRPCKDTKKNSFDLVMPNIPILLSYWPDLTFRATIDQDTAKYTADNYLFAESMGFKSVFFVPNHRNIWTQEHLSDLEQAYKLIFKIQCDKFLHKIMPIRDAKIEDGYKFVYRYYQQASALKYPTYESVYSPTRCGLSTTGCSIGYDGSIYGCQEQDSKDNKNIFYIGNINQGIDVELQNHLLQEYSYQGAQKCELRPYCSQCQIRSLCYDPDCPSTSYDLYKDFAIHPFISCFFNNLLFKYANENYNFLFNQNNNTFIEYLNKLIRGE